jgi:hypothetical protein
MICSGKSLAITIMRDLRNTKEPLATGEYQE